MKIPIRPSLRSLLAGGTILLALGGVLVRHAVSSDHADTPEIAASPGTDITDVFMFPSTENPNNVVLAMTVSPLIGAGQSATRSFDPNVLYQFKIDNTGDSVEDLVIQAKFDNGSSTNQIASVVGPSVPAITGAQSKALSFNDSGNVGSIFTTSGGMRVFTGPREDPFFFDLEQFFTILPDRASPLDPTKIQPVGEESKPRATTWRTAANAKDFLKDLNVLAIVIEVPKSAIKGNADGKVRLWCTTSK
jgi:Domain of unknown function (DUF4331)